MDTWSVLVWTGNAALWIVDKILWLFDHIPWVIDLLANVSVPSLTSVWDAFVVLVEWLGTQGMETLRALGIDAGVPALTSIGDWIWQGVQWLGTQAMETLRSASSTSSGAIFQNLAGAASKLGELIPLLSETLPPLSEAVNAISQGVMNLGEQGFADPTKFIINTVSPLVQSLAGDIGNALLTAIPVLVYNTIPILYPLGDLVHYVVLNVGALLVVSLHPQFTEQAVGVLEVAILSPITEYLIPAIIAIFAPILPALSKRLSYSGTEAGVALNLVGKQLRKKTTKLVSAIHWFENPENPKGFHALTRVIHLARRKPSPATANTPRRADMTDRLPRIYAPMGGNIPAYTTIGGTL